MGNFFEEYGAVVIEFVFLHTIVSILFKILSIVWGLNV